MHLTHTRPGMRQVGPSQMPAISSEATSSSLSEVPPNKSLERHPKASTTLLSATCRAVWRAADAWLLGGTGRFGTTKCCSITTY